MEVSSRLRARSRKALEEYLKYRSLAALRECLSQEERNDLSLPIDDTNKSKEEAVAKIIDYFLMGNSSQKLYDFSSFFNTLREELKTGDDLRSTFNKCYEALKDEILVAKIASLYEEEPDFHVTVNGEHLKQEDVKELAIQLSKNDSIREELLHLLPSIAFSAGEQIYLDGADFDIARWKLIVEEVIQILKACFTHATDRKYDIEFVTTSIIEKDNYIDNEWINFHKEVVCRKLSHKRITYTPLKHLQEILSHAGLSEQDFREAYVASLGEQPPSETMPKLLPLMLHNLAEAEIAIDSIPIIKFIEYLINDIGNTGTWHVQKKLMDWNRKMIRLFDRDNNWLNTLRQQVQDEANRSMYLLIAVKSDKAQSMAEAEEKQKFRVRAWLADDENNIVAYSDQSKEAVSFDDIPKCIDKIRMKFKKYLSTIAIVDLFFPNYLLSRNIDTWQIKVGSAEAQFVAEHTWVMRSLERAEKNELIKYKWDAKWKSFQSYRANGDTGKLVHMYAQGDCADKDVFYRKLTPPSIFCVALDFVPPAPHTTHIFTKMLDVGIPIIFWRRQETSAPLNSFSEWLPKWIEELLEKNGGDRRTENLKNLPLLICEARRSAEREDEHVYHLILLWDDPNRLPPLLYLTRKRKYE